jgi:MFS family permease
VERITGLTSLLVLPWVFKFLWAPLVDALRSPRWTLRSWIVAAQITMGLSLLPCAVLSFQQDYAVLVSLLLVHAFAAATQDAAIDALSIAHVPSNERGAINGWMQAGMLTGRALFGGGALFLMDRLGQQSVIGLLIAVVWSSMALVSFTRPAETVSEIPSPVADRWHDFAKRLGEIGKRKATWFGLAFALVAGAGFEAVGAVAGPYLVDRANNKEEVGVFFGIPVVAGMLSGALLGGYLSDRIGRQRSVALFLILFCLSILILVGLDRSQDVQSRSLVFVPLAILYVAIGMFTSASYALFMDITDPKLGATQFSTYMGATNGCEAWSAFAVGKLHTLFGYWPAFGIMTCVSILSLPLLRYTHDRTLEEGASQA